MSINTKQSHKEMEVIILQNELIFSRKGDCKLIKCWYSNIYWILLILQKRSQILQIWKKSEYEEFSKKKINSPKQ